MPAALSVILTIDIRWVIRERIAAHWGISPTPALNRLSFLSSLDICFHFPFFLLQQQSADQIADKSPAVTSTLA